MTVDTIAGGVCSVMHLREFMAKIHRVARRMPYVPSPDTVTCKEMDNSEASDVTTDGCFC